MLPGSLLTTDQSPGNASQGQELERGDAEGLGRVSGGLAPEVRPGFAPLECQYQACKRETSLLSALVNKITKRMFPKKRTHHFWANLSYRFVTMDKEPLNLITSS